MWALSSTSSTELLLLVVERPNKGLVLGCRGAPQSLGLGICPCGRDEKKQFMHLFVVVTSPAPAPAPASYHTRAVIIQQHGQQTRTQYHQQQQSSSPPHTTHLNKETHIVSYNKGGNTHTLPPSAHITSYLRSLMSGSTAFCGDVGLPLPASPAGGPAADVGLPEAAAAAARSNTMYD